MGHHAARRHEPSVLPDVARLLRDLGLCQVYFLPDERTRLAREFGEEVAKAPLIAPRVHARNSFSDPIGVLVPR